jgi:hypothetical protein
MSQNADGEPVENVDAEETEVLLADPDDYHQSQRLREIHKARRKVHDKFTNIDTFTEDDIHSNQKGQLAHAVAAYVVELLPIFRQTDTNTALPHPLPWDTLGEYVTTTGFKPDEREYCGYQVSMSVFETANQRFAEVKPLVEPDETDEWEIET